MPALLAPQPKCARAWAEGGHILAGAGSGCPTPPLLAARAGTSLIHPRSGSGAAECRSPAQPCDPQPMPGAGTGSLTHDLFPPGFQWLPPVPGRGPVRAGLGGIKIYSTQSHILAAPVCHWQGREDAQQSQRTRAPGEPVLARHSYVSMLYIRITYSNSCLHM